MNWVIFWWLVLLAFVVNLGWRVAKLPPERRWRVAVRECLIMILLYCGMMAMLMFMEHKLIFVPSSAEEDWREPVGLKVEDVWLDCPTEARPGRCHAWWCPVNGADRTLLYCHGNAGNLSGRIEQVELWQKHLNANVLIFDYPGYGRSAGEPSETTCYAAGRAAYRWLREVKHINPDSIVLYGKSLGGAVAMELARTEPHQALVLYSAFTSIPDMAQKMLPFFPSRWLVRTRLDNLTKVQEYRGPLIIGHGDEDELVPPEHGQRLYDAAGTRDKLLRRYPGQEHGAPPAEFFAQVAEFLKRLPPRTTAP